MLATPPSSKLGRRLAATCTATALATLTATLGAGLAPPAQAQSTASGSVFGQVGTHAGTQVRITNPATGFTRTAGVDADGRFYLSSLPPGRYRVELLDQGALVASVELEVVAGVGAEATFEAPTVTQLETVRVVGRARTIDVSSASNVSTFTASQLDKLPIASRNLNGIIALAPNTTAADPRYAGGVSIGGGAPSENSYYIDGFPVTNALTQLGSIELPLGAIQQAQVQTGGFGAEFGRSVGGVVNLITKSGTNTWEGGAQIAYQPESLRARRPDLYYANTGSNPNTDGTVYLYRGGNFNDDTLYSAHVGGPLVRDKLFLFVAASQEITRWGAVNATPQASTLGSQGWLAERDSNTRYLGKLDWYLNDDHRLQLTLLGDNYGSNFDYYGYDYATHVRTAVLGLSESARNLGGVTPAVGGQAQVLRYIGNINDRLTVNALYGQSSSRHAQNYVGDLSAPQTSWTADTRMPGLGYPAIPPNPLGNGATVIPPDARDTTKSLRLDVEYRLGRHLLRAGVDENRLKSAGAGETVAGGSAWIYARTTDPGFTGVGGVTPIGQLTAPIRSAKDGKDYYYVYQYIFDDATSAESDQSALYLEDRFQATKTWLVTLGLRNESFTNKNGDGLTFLQSKNFLSPRLSTSWDVHGDASLKVFGSLGRYSLQIPTHIAVRGASRSLYTFQYFAYTGVDPVTGLPTGLSPTGDATSVNNEYGQAKDINTVSALNIKPTYQDEVTLGFEKALTPAYNGGASLTYRKLKATIDDFCDERPFLAYAASRGIDTSRWGGFGCASFNPGVANGFLVDYAGNGNYSRVDLSAADLGFERAKRTYLALDFFVEHPLRHGWYGRLTYTYSRSRGNTEGQTKSDNAQTDVAATSTWDTPELMQYAYGPLPNDRAHQVKANGYYQLNPEWIFGANFRFESGRPRNCFGNDPRLPADAPDYGNVYFYCDGQPAPRGSRGRLPSTTTLDLNASYAPRWSRGLSLRLDVFNVFNRLTPTLYDETREPRFDAATVRPEYGRVMSYAAPRSARVTLAYEF